MNQRGASVERPFAQLKQIMGMQRVPCWGNTGANAEGGRAVLAYTLTSMIHELGIKRWLPMIEPERGRQKQIAQLKQIMGMQRVPCWGNTGANAEGGRAVLAYTLTSMIHELGIKRWLPMIEPERGRQKQRTLPGRVLVGLFERFYTLSSPDFLQVLRKAGLTSCRPYHPCRPYPA